MNSIPRIRVTQIAIVALIVVCWPLAALPLAQGTNDTCIEGDCINGVGTFKWSNGDKYTGEFKGGVR